MGPGRVFALLLLALAAGCNLLYSPPDVGLREVVLEGIGRDGASLEIALDVYNPNRYALGLDELTYRLSVAGIETASGRARAALRVPAKSSTTLQVPVTLDWSRLRAGGWQLLTSGRADYTVEGEATFSTPAGSFRRPYRRTGTIGGRSQVRPETR